MDFGFLVIYTLQIFLNEATAPPLEIRMQKYYTTALKTMNRDVHSDHVFCNRPFNEIRSE